ncbi:MAG TPA: RT0821/Lpp0805 family surface protein [Mesorhizobium sp.]|jgi:surface antigen|nr:RT0821/Lpp0805 family surface protein [Mesorhizobium sp.]
MPLKWPVVLVPLLLAACSSTVDSLGVSGVDTASLTGSAGLAPQEPEKLSDQATIRDAVSSADLEAAGANPLAWANTETGSRGAITALNERRDGGKLCRSFTTSRESYDGVAMYAGEACKTESGPWRMLDFKPL